MVCHSGLQTGVHTVGRGKGAMPTGAVPERELLSGKQSAHLHVSICWALFLLSRAVSPLSQLKGTAPG